LSYITINKQNFFHNLDICSKRANCKENVAIVLKDNAYGHGLIEISSLAKEYGITKAVVQNIDEAKKIESYFEYILILADTKKESLSHSFHITINTIDDIDLLEENTNIHIKIDTGMHRNGIAPNELKSTIHKALKRNLNITGVFTHFKSADIMSSVYFYQKSIFRDIKKSLSLICEQLNISKIKLHSCNSSALFREENFSEDLCRIGIAAYGYIENEDPLYVPNLKPVLSLNTQKISSRTLKKGQTIGYGGNFIANEDMQISTYDIGYGDGFKRLSKNEYFQINKKERTLGNISMDNMSINSTKDEICLFDDVKPLAKLHNTISYEILTSLSPSIKRVIV